MDDDGDYFFSAEAERQPDDSIFTLNEEPIPVHLHHSLGSGGRNALARKIEDAGGYPYATEDEARVIVCRYNTPVFTQLEYLYDHDRFKWVEPPSWVDTCLMTGKYEHHLPSSTDKTDRRVTSRNPFSLDDDEYLVKFLAHRIPYKESGGRQGNGVYKDLCSAARLSRYPWAARHTWQSWRDRYTKNQDIFDPRIAYAVKHDANPPKPGDKGQYVIPRRTRKPQPLRYNVQEEEEDEEYEEDLEDERQEEAEVFGKSTNKRYRMESSSQPDRHSKSYQPSFSPPRKRSRVQHTALGSASDASAGLGRDQWKGKGHRISIESEDDRPEGDMESGHIPFPAMYDDDNEPGPFHHYEEPNVSESSPSSPIPTPSAVLRAAAIAKSSEAIDGSRQGSRGMPPPPDSQITLAVPTQRARDHGTPPPDTQATVVPPPPRSKLEPSRQAARRGASREPAPQAMVARNTRSRRLPGSDFVQLSLSPAKQHTKGGHGRPSIIQQQGPSSKRRLPSDREDEEQHASASVAVNASLREEVQVEEILQVPAGKATTQESQEQGRGDQGQGSNNESLSSEDDEPTRMLRHGSRRMISQAAQSMPRSSSRHVTMFPNRRTLAAQATRGGGGGGGGRKQLAARHMPSDALNPGTDADATPRASQMRMKKKAAKKTAARDPSSAVPEEDSGSGSVAGAAAGTDTTDSSFPVELTMARDYTTARSAFTPARGTMAEEHVRTERSRRSTRRSTRGG